MLTVNYFGRSGHSNTKIARRSDQGIPYDVLFFDESHYWLYEHAADGIWELQPREGDDMLRPVLLQDPTDVDLKYATVRLRRQGRLIRRISHFLFLLEVLSCEPSSRTQSVQSVLRLI